MSLTAYDLYNYLNAALEFYMDSIAVKEDPTDEERKKYEYIKYWKPSSPDDSVKEILKSLVFSNKDKQKNNDEEK